MFNVNTDTLLNGVFGLVDELFTTEEEKANARLKVLELHSKGALAQIAVNTEEAGHASKFVAGWRPFIGWTCGVSFAWVFVARPVIDTVAYYLGTDVSGLPDLDLSAMMPVLLGMLGLGAMRSFEKNAGVSRNSINRKAE